MDTNSLHLLRSESFDIANPNVSIEVVPDRVKIIESNDGKCYVEFFAKSESAKQLTNMIDLSATGDKLTVHVRRPKGGLRQFLDGLSNRLTVVVKLPKSSTMKIKTISGDVEVSQGVKKLEVTTISGNISVLQNPSEMCTLNSISGEITARTFSGCHYSLRSISGDITVHVAPDLEIDVDGKSISGDMASEISLSSSGEPTSDESEVVVITANTISGDFVLARN